MNSITPSNKRMHNNTTVYSSSIDMKMSPYENIKGRNNSNHYQTLFQRKNPNHSLDKSLTKQQTTISGININERPVKKLIASNFDLSYSKPDLSPNHSFNIPQGKTFNLNFGKSNNQSNSQLNIKDGKIIK
jgi:hypothetical protein